MEEVSGVFDEPVGDEIRARGREEFLSRVECVLKFVRKDF